MERETMGQGRMRVRGGGGESAQAVWDLLAASIKALFITKSQPGYFSLRAARQLTLGPAGSTQSSRTARMNPASPLNMRIMQRLLSKASV